MNKFEFALISVRLLAVYFIAQGLNFLPSVVSIFWTTPLLSGPGSEPGYANFSSYYKTFIISQFVVSIIMGMFVFSFSRPLAEWLDGPDSSHDSQLHVSPVELHGIVFSIAGVVLLYFALPTLLGTAVTVAFSRGVGAYAGPILTPEQVPRLIGEIVQLLLAIWLIVGTKFWMRLIYRFRTVGLAESSGLADESVESDSQPNL